MTDEEIKLWRNRATMVLDYIEAERARCIALIKEIDYNPAFLLYCIEYSYQPNEVEQARTRFEELGNAAPTYKLADPDPFEDLM